MRPIYQLLLLCVATAASAQDQASPKLSSTPLTADQIAVYRAFLRDYQSGSKTALHVANITGPLQPDDGDYSGCMKAFPKGIAANEVHLLPTGLAPNIDLVDPSKYKHADVGDFMHDPGDLDRAVDSAIAAGLMSLSEVILDKSRHFAAVNFSFICGKLCGHGGTVIFELRTGKWRRSKLSCGSWQS